MITVVHISYVYGECDTGGAAIAATRLHKALIERGVNSHFVCVLMREKGENVHVLPRESSILRKLYLYLTKMTRGFWRFTPYRDSIPLNVVPLWGLEKLLTKIKPDIIHVHWINADVCSFEQLAGLPYKLLFNLHDFFMLFGRGYLDGNELCRNSFLTENSTILLQWLDKRRRCLIEKKKALFIGPSVWACKVCNASVVGNGFPTFVVPNIISDVFNYNIDLGFAKEKFVILFGAYGGRRVATKGFCDLEVALELLPQEIKDDSELWIFGEDSSESMISGVATKFKGSIADEKKLALLYNEADVFAFPSIKETQGMTKIEAMMSGLPVVAFDRTACAEGIVHRKTGWIAPDKDRQSFAEGLRFFYDMWASGVLKLLRAEISRVARMTYSKDTIIERILDIYER